MNKTNGRKVNYRTMSILAIIVGAFGMILQFISGWEFFSLFLTVVVLSGLIGGSGGYEERDRVQLERSYKTVVEGLLLVIFAAYAFGELSRWVGIIEGAVIFLNSHWPGLIISIMCILMGVAGSHNTGSEGSAEQTV